MFKLDCRLDKVNTGWKKFFLVKAGWYRIDLVKTEKWHRFDSNHKGTVQRDFGPLAIFIFRTSLGF